MTYVATGRTVDQPVSFRITEEQAAMMSGLRATFGPVDSLQRSYPGNGWGMAFRWLLDQPEVRSLIAGRVETIMGDDPQ